MQHASISSPDTQKQSHFYVVIAVVAAFAGILFGFDTGVISGAILFVTAHFHLSVFENSVVVSMVLAGAFVGAIVSGRLADYVGRKRMLIIDAIIFIISTLISALAPNVAVLIIGRFIVGIAIGISSYIAPLYISEISPPHRRGALVSLNQLAISFGILLSYIVDYIFSHSGAWRAMFAAGVIPAFILLVGMFFLPFSPRWILKRGDEYTALKILERLRGKGKSAEQEFARIKSSLQLQKGSWRMLFSKNIMPALVIAAGLAVVQQVTGINTIIYYAPTIFKIAGFHSASVAILATMGVGAVMMIATAIGLPFIDSLGRRPLLFIGVTLMAISLAALSWAFFMHSHDASLPWIALSSMVVYMVGFSIGLGPIMWLLIAEVFPLKVRGLGTSLASCVNWGSNWLVAITFLSIVKFIHAGGAFLIYFIVSVLSLVWIYFYVPETKGIALEQIEENLYEGKHARHIGDHRAD